MPEKILFRGKEYLFIPKSGDITKTNGAIATPEQYENFQAPFAHLFPDGLVRQLGQVIGKREEIFWEAK